MQLAEPVQESSSRLRNHASSDLGRLADLLLFFTASILIGRAIPQRDVPGADWVAYAHGEIGLPFQARYMMVPVLRAAHESTWWASAANALKNSAQSPEQLAIQVVDILGILVAGFSARKLQHVLAPASRLGWLTKWVLLWIVVITYLARYEQAQYTPYDFPSLGLFSLGIVFAAYGFSVPFVLITILATFNRETAFFLLPIWFMLQIYDKPKPKAAILTAFIALAGCFAVRALIYHWISVHNSGLQLIVFPNFKELLPHHLPQVLSAGGFLLLPLALMWRKIQGRELQRLWIGFTPFIIAALAVGLWNESRIFGEMSIAVACTATLLLEAHLNSRPVEVNSFMKRG